jgi:YkoY family integral membrane protein
MEAETLPTLSSLLQGVDQWGEVLWVLPLLVVLEVVLSADNAIALAAISRRLHDPQKQRQALNFGLLLALGFRIALIIAARWVLRFWPLQLLAAAYLLWLSGSHLLAADQAPGTEPATDDTPADTPAAAVVDAQIPSPSAEVPAAGGQIRRLVGVVVTLGLTDLAFSLDSVAAAVAVTDRLVLVMAGGVIGVVALRLTAELFIRWLDEFRHLETSGYLAVALVGIRLLVRLINPDLVLPEWAVLLSVAVIFAWGFSARNDPPTPDAPVTGSAFAPEVPAQGAPPLPGTGAVAEVSQVD